MTEILFVWHAYFDIDCRSEYPPYAWFGLIVFPLVYRENVTVLLAASVLVWLHCCSAGRIMIFQASLPNNSKTPRVLRKGISAFRATYTLVVMVLSRFRYHWMRKEGYSLFCCITKSHSSLPKKTYLHYARLALSPCNVYSIYLWASEDFGIFGCARQDIDCRVCITKRSF